MKLCPKCNSSHEKLGLYCSRSCANSRTFDDESRQKKSVSVKRYYEKNGVRPSKIKGRTIPKDRLAKREATRKANAMIKFQAGKVKDRTTLKKIITELRGYACVSCGISEWCGKLLSLHLDHIDGDAGNNMPNNVRLLCPNCHSLTETFGARNKGSGRKARGLKVH